MSTVDCYRKFVPVDLPPESDFAYRNNNNMVAHIQGSSVFPTRAFTGDYPSQDMIVAGDIYSGKFVLVGALTAFRSLTYLYLRKQGRYTGIIVEQPDIKIGEKPEEILILEGNDWRELMAQYADKAASQMGVNAIDASSNATGYCTWYYYYAGVTEAHLLENLEAISRKPDNGGIKYFQIDDGYQPFQGDWLERRESWPSPLNETAAKIADKGIIPGIWIMPFMASTVSRVFQEHKEWFVKNENGEPLLVRGWSAPPDTHWGCLDATRKDVREHLRSVFRTFYDWGFRYFKMDGLGLGLPDGIRKDPNSTPVSAYRLALQTIREAVPDALLLGCGAPFMPTLGMVDHCRVSYDTARYYQLPKPDHANGDDLFKADMKTAIHVLMSHWWKFDRWFRADPDALMTRQDNAYYTYGEAKMSALTGILTGVCTTSDHFGTIDDNRFELLKKAFKYRLHEAKPLSWETGFWPQVFIGNLSDGRKAAAIFNDSDKTMTYYFEDMGLNESCIELLEADVIHNCKIILAPHDAALLAELKQD